MDATDITCHICSALVTPLGQEGGVFCTRNECPGDRLSRVDVTNICEPHPFCLNFSGERVLVATQTTTEPSPEPAKRVKRRPLPTRARTLFDT